MRAHWLVFGLICLGVAVTGCELQGGFPTVNPSNGGGSASSGQMKLMVNGGLVSIPTSAVQNMTVQIYAAGSSKFFSGTNAQALLGPIDFSTPGNGYVSTGTTGQITINFESNGVVETKTFSINSYSQNGSSGQFVQDEVYSVQYRATQPLDSHWIGD